MNNEQSASTEKPARTASECPNCYTDNNDETDCPHLLTGDDCPNCGTEMEKPTAGKVECPNCEWVVNGQNQGFELRRYSLTFRQASRLLQLFGYDRPTTPGNAENALGRLCLNNDIERETLNDVLDDIRGSGVYAQSIQPETDQSETHTETDVSDSQKGDEKNV